MYDSVPVPKSRVCIEGGCQDVIAFRVVSIARQSREHVIVPRAKAAFRLSL
jgi:hypothetical protein